MMLAQNDSASSVAPPLFQDFDPLTHALTALVYAEGFAIGDLFKTVADRARGAGLRLGGLIERGSTAAPGRRCDMVLQDLASGATIKISEDRGALARGCRLDLDGLIHACAMVMQQLSGCDLILLNKFGKAEAEGGGLRCVISDALALEIPVVIGVPRRNLAAWRDFAGEFAQERRYGGA